MVYITAFEEVQQRLGLMGTVKTHLQPHASVMIMTTTADPFILTSAHRGRSFSPEVCLDASCSMSAAIRAQRLLILAVISSSCLDPRHLTLDRSIHARSEQCSRASDIVSSNTLLSQTFKSTPAFPHLRPCVRNRTTL